MSVCEYERTPENVCVRETECENRLTLTPKQCNCEHTHTSPQTAIMPRNDALNHITIANSFLTLEQCAHRERRQHLEATVLCVFAGTKNSLLKISLLLDISSTISRLID